MTKVTNQDLLRPNTGPLDAKEIASEMNSTAQNGRRLVGDAEILLEAGRHASAASLAILAIEESGKIAILREMSGIEERAELKRDWRR